MPTLVEIPGKGIAEFPDDLGQAEILKSIEESFPDLNPPSLRAEIEPPGTRTDLTKAPLTPFGDTPTPMQEEMSRRSAEARNRFEQEWPDILETLKTPEKLITQVIGDAAFGQIATLPRVPEQPPDAPAWKKIGAGGVNAVAGLAEFFLTPVGLATLGTGSLPVSAQRVIAGTFAADMIRHTPEIGRQLGEAWERGDLQKASELALTGLGTAYFTAKTGGTALKSNKTLLSERLASELERTDMVNELDAAKAPLTAQAVKQTIKPETEVPSALQQESQTVPRDVLKPEVAPESAKEVPVDGGRPPIVEAPITTEERPKPARRTPTTERSWDIIDELESNLGGKLSLPKARALIEGFKPTGRLRKLFTNDPNAAAPDIAAQSVSQFKRFGSDAEFLEALDAASKARIGQRKTAALEAQQLLTEQNQAEQFGKRVLEGERPKAERENVERVVVNDLLEGDTFEVQGNKFKVEKLNVDEDGYLIDLMIKDGPKFGVQRVAADDVIHIDKATLDKAKQSAPEFLPPEPFSLEGNVGREELQREAVIQAERQRQATERAALEQRAKAPLTGSSAEVSQGKLFRSESDLLSGPSAEESLKWTKATSGAEDLLREVKEQIVPEESQTLGITPSPALARASAAIRRVGSAMLKPPKMTDYTRGILDWSAKLQRSFGEIREAQKTIQSVARKPIRREAITNWIEANGDDALLASRASASIDAKLKSGYEAARTLTPEELTVAREVKAAFDALFVRGQKYDVLDSFRDNYVNHIWERGGLISRLSGSSKRLSDQFRFAKARTFDSFFTGEQAGFKPKTKDIAKLLPVYIHEMNNAIAAKQLVEKLNHGVASDGRPLLAPRGNASTIENETGKAYLVMPKRVKVEDTADYRTLPDQPALQSWRWVSADEVGNPIYLRADLALHPEIFPKVRNILGQSEIKTWYQSETTPLASIPKALVQAIDKSQATMKKTMLGFLSTFHQVQEGTHAIAHRINPFSNVPKIDLSRNASQMDAARHGLMLNPDRISEHVFMEGLGERSGIIGRIPVLGKLADAYAEYLFHSYIPGLKFKTYEHILERNEKLFAKELNNGTIALEDVKLLSSQQSNAAFGHLNYAELARNPTMQHLLQLSLLAPDFLEARGRFAAQAIKGFASKAGTEQLVAIAFMAAVQFGAAKLINKLVDDEWHFDHPFEVVAGGRRYVLRSVPEDLYNLFKDTRQFVYGRLNPLTAKGAVQLVTEQNYRGEKVTAGETLTELLAQYIPITLRWMPGVKELTQTSKNRPVTPLQELAGTLGLRISRYSPITEMYRRAGEWRKEQNLPEDRGVYPISKYQQMRYALEDGDLDRARDEYLKLIESGMTARQIQLGFTQSINHPFTGKAQSDAQFEKWLDEKGKLLYDEAIRKRKQILQAFNSVRAAKP